MSRARLTADQWRDVLERHRQSDQSVPAFCAEHDLKSSTFFAWRRRLRDEAVGNGGGFVELTVQPDEASPSSAWLPVVLPRGVTVRVGRDFDADLLRRVVEALS